jgi:hypothetical protein
MHRKVGEGSGAPEKIRTSDLQLRRLPLYPAELRARRLSLAWEAGHPQHGLTAGRGELSIDSTNEAGVGGPKARADCTF